MTEVLAKNGTMVYCSTTLDGAGTVNIGGSFSRQTVIKGSYGGTIKNLKQAIEYVQAGVLRPVIDSVFPLEKASDALALVAQQKVFGKIVLKMGFTSIKTHQ
jgi:NADPH:quinone reductase-like Zn-dependent oxidoreductase